MFSPVCRDRGRIHTQNLSGLLEGSALVASSVAFNRYIQDLIFLWAIFTLIDSVMLAEQPGFGWHAKRDCFSKGKNYPAVEREVSTVSDCHNPSPKGTGVGHLRQWGHRRPATPWSPETLKLHMPLFFHT